MNPKRCRCAPAAAFLLLAVMALVACAGDASYYQRRRKAINFLNLADRYRKRGDHYLAKGLYYKSLDWHELPDAHFGLGACYLELKQYTQAEYHFRKALAAKPHLALYRSQAQYAAMLARGEGEAAQAPERPATDRPTAPETTARASPAPPRPTSTPSVSPPQRATASAARPTPAAQSRKPRPTARAVRDALFHDDAGEKPTADAPRPADLDRDPDSGILLGAPSYHLDKGRSLESRGMLAEALTEYEQASRVAPDDLDVRLRIVALLTKMGREEKAARLLERLRTESPDSPDVHFLAGNFHYKREEYFQAMDAYKKAVALDPAMAKACINLGLTYLELEAYLLATEAFEKALEIDPDNLHAHLNLGIVLDGSGLPGVQARRDVARARRHYQRYIDLGGERADEVRQWIEELAATEKP